MTPKLCNITCKHRRLAPGYICIDEPYKTQINKVHSINVQNVKNEQFEILYLT